MLRSVGWKPLAQGVQALRRGDCRTAVADSLDSLRALREQADPWEVLTYCDLTTSPDGDPVSVETRLSEIERRYDDTGPVGRFIHRARVELTAAVSVIEERLAERQSR